MRLYWPASTRSNGYVKTSISKSWNYSKNKSSNTSNSLNSKMTNSKRYRQSSALQSNIAGHCYPWQPMLCRALSRSRTSFSPCRKPLLTSRFRRPKRSACARWIQRRSSRLRWKIPWGGKSQFRRSGSTPWSGLFVHHSC